MNKGFLLNIVCSQIIAGFCLLVLSSGANAIESPADSAMKIVNNYRKIIVLFADENNLSEAEQERAGIIGKIIFHENRDLQQKLAENLKQDYQSSAGSHQKLEAFLGWVENDSDLWDADKLVFKGMLESLHAGLARAGNKTAKQENILHRILEDVKDLKEIQVRYDKEIKSIFSQIKGRAIENRRQSWNRYVDHIKSGVKRGDVILAYDAEDNLMPSHRSKKADSLEFFGHRFPKKTIALTFDDGPHATYSDRILAILKERGVSATFFAVGKSVGKIEKKKVVLSKKSAVSKRILADGHLLANHSYSHRVMPKLKQGQMESEIQDTNKILKAVSGVEPALFRAPYGARNDNILATVKNLEMKSIMWNVDSRDWADPIPRSVARRVMEQVDKRGRGIILFHDVQASTVDALPYVIDSLVARGYSFAQWNGKAFTTDKSTAVTVEKNKELSLYNNKWAVVIGINKYKHWPKLKYAVNDANGIRELLINEYHFKPERIITLIDEQASRSGIISALMDKLGDPDKVKKNDSVFVFYAGHGATRHLPSGRDLGYIIPYEAQSDTYYSSAISMTHFRDITEAIPAKHIFFIMDSCYSGLALTRGSTLNSRNFLQENAKRLGRQIITAGGADQQVSDEGPYGHSVFTWTLLQGLKGQGDLNKDGFITASELSAYVSPIVSSISMQTPAFGNMVGSEGGDYVFALNGGASFLSELTTSASEQEIALNKKLDKLQQEIQHKRDRNLKLQKELAHVKALLETKESTVTKVGRYDRNQSVILNEKGLQKYRNRELDNALNYFIKAADADPSYSEASNNAGFVLYRLGKYTQSVEWLEKTTLLDPKRAVSWLNLGDSYAKMNEKKKATAAYKTYLSIKPDSAGAESVKAKLVELRK